ncbi:glycosyltransferase [Arthrobacter sp. ISL-48]|uniref:glycosyltransferase n=1 Tax=Arthrobacter sp. ISL-48 TaxID=2819110 RepID=UPI001BE69F83|nr:glycosyltransferase [Arthrobacter sp. ISL-48]MBT2533317.1 glycosyltransferase [Arthrobacter sp. ISL-48]
MSKKKQPGKYVLYLAVLPKYRTECVRILTDVMGDNLRIFVSSAHLDESVKTGIPKDLYTQVSIRRLLRGRAFIQLGSWGPAVNAKTTVLDLNPRSISAWLLLAIRAALGRRTLVWGHIHPQAGAGSRTAVLRRIMRRIAKGTISYTYRDAEKAISDIPGSAVWIAPNSLYRKESVRPALDANDAQRSSVLYVGRFAPAKKVSLLVEAFGEAVRTQPDMRLILVGGGSEEAALRHLTSRLGIAEQVEFPGWIDDLEALSPFYARAFCSVSPGFAGLGLTQSLGFGVPMLVADDEPHSPEIELDASGGVTYFRSNSNIELSKTILTKWENRDNLPNLAISRYTKLRYSAEAMASGLEDALKNSRTNLL